MSGEMDRKEFLKRGWLGLFAPFLAEVEKEDEWLPPPDPSRLMRPPGAIPEPDFLSTCHRCGTCVEACPADAIRLAYHGESLPAGTPVVVAVESPCVVCDSLACMSKCPSGALKRIPRESIKMGIARINPGHCLVWNGEDPECRICIEMCPFPGTAIALDGEMTNGEKGPAVHENACTGCGVCEYYCPSGPTAIIVEPMVTAP